MSKDQLSQNLLIAAQDSQVERLATDFAERGLSALDIEPDDLDQLERDFQSRHPQVDFDAAVMARLLQVSGTE